MMHICHALWFFQSVYLLGGITASVEKRADRFGSGNFIKTHAETPRISHGSGQIHKVSGNIVEGTKDRKLVNKLLKEIYKAILPRRQQVKGNDVKPEGLKLVPNTMDNNVSGLADRKITEKSKDFKSLGVAIDRLIAVLSDKREAGTGFDAEEIRKGTQKLNDFADFADVTSNEEVKNEATEKKKKDGVKSPATEKSKFVNFDEFKRRFFHTFLKSDEEQKIIYNGKKDDSDVNEAFDNKKKSLSDLYEDLKRETKEEQKRLATQKEEQKPIVKEMEINKIREIKKKELISLLNDVFGKNKLVYDGKRVKLARYANEVDETSNADDKEFERLYKNEGNSDGAKKADKTANSIKYIFMDAFRREMNKNVQADDPVKKVVQTVSEQNVRKERLKNYLLDFVHKLDSKEVKKNFEQNSANSVTPKKSSNHMVSKAARFESELDDIASKSKQKQSFTPNEEMLEALKGFEFVRDSSSNEKRSIHERP